MVLRIRIYLSKTHRNTSSNKNKLQSVMQTVMNGLNTVYGMEENEHAEEQQQQQQQTQSASESVPRVVASRQSESYSHQTHVMM